MSLQARAWLLRTVYISGELYSPAGVAIPHPVRCAHPSFRSWPPAVYLGMPHNFPWDKRSPAIFCSPEVPLIVNDIDTLAKANRMMKLLGNCTMSW
jgi:hypothetical protein